jgi:chromate reductase
MRVLGLCGSLRRDFYNRRLLDAAAKELPEATLFRVFDEIDDIPPSAPRWPRLNCAEY